jgi:hypothetical protein
MNKFNIPIYKKQTTFINCIEHVNIKSVFCFTYIRYVNDVMFGIVLNKYYGKK